MIKEKRTELNEEQKKAAYCEENAVVAAGAGSGKTMVLASRFAWLITEKGYKIDEILTLTFTKKAANQMFRRIHSELSYIAENEKGEKAKRANTALNNFINARIQTLDSYSTAIVRQCASRYGISPEFEISLERSKKIAEEESLPFLIANRRHPAIEKLYSENRPNGITFNILSEILNNCLIDKQHNFINEIKNQFETICAEWEKITKELITIIEEIKGFGAEIEVLCPDLFIRINKYKGKEINFITTKDIRDYLNILLDENPLTVIEKAENHQIQETLTCLLFYIYDIQKSNLKVGKRNDNPVKEKINLLRIIFEKFSSLVVYCMQAGLILSFVSMLNELQTRFLQRKRSEGVLTFKDIANLSRTILLEQKDIRQSEKEAFKAIMIDEFQDNNDIQKEILFLIAENIDKCGNGIPSSEDLCRDKLFFVGDEKQSIYLFNGADVSVFRKLKNEIKGENLPLKINYRSVSGLIGAFNAIFGGSIFDPKGKEKLYENASVFSSADSPSQPVFEASYTPLEAHKEETGNLTFCILNRKSEKKYFEYDGENDNENDDENDERLNETESEARFVAEKIENLLKEKTPDGNPKYQPDDIAILFRSHKPQRLFEKHLRFLNIPYASEDINDLFFSGVVNDIMSVLFLVSHKLDSLSYAEMLRSPFAGLSLNGTSICLSLRNNDNFDPFNDDPIEFLDEDDCKKYQHGKKIYKLISEKAANENIASLVSELWYNQGYRYETEWHPNTSIYKEYFDNLYHLAVTTDNANQGLAFFTEYIRTFRESDDRLRDVVIPLDRKSAVRLMSIHKSKGLEFPVVFVCCCERRVGGNKTKKAYNSEKYGIILSPPVPDSCRNILKIKKNFFWEYVKKEEKRKNTAELRRLLYVAMTRAEEKLFITGILNIKESETDNFSLKIKDYTNLTYEEKEKDRIKKGEISIEGDTIINNDTLFGLLLPPISAHIPPDGLNKETSFFCIEEIPMLSEEDLHERKHSIKFLKNNQEGLNEYIKKSETFYDKAQVIKTPIVTDNHLTPVSFKEKNIEFSSAHKINLIVNNDFSGDKSDDIFKKVDKILSSYSKKDGEENSKYFNAGSFGTVAHSCVEALLNKEEAFIPSNIACLLKPAELPVILEAGNELAKRFALSPLGKTAGKAALRENEFKFRSLIKNKNDKNELFINGTIDLFFEDKKCIHVVDFKTDSEETPEEHAAQMTFYFHAVSDLYSSCYNERRVWLYYLRTGHAVEMTEYVKSINIKALCFN